MEYYSDNTYTDEYYLTQYILTTIYLRKKYCAILLTIQEIQFLKERMPEITLQKLYSIPDSIYDAYQVYQE